MKAVFEKIGEKVTNAVQKATAKVKEIFNVKETPGIHVVVLKEDGEPVMYKDAVGFFDFRGDLFYKAKGAAGYNLITGKPFMQVITEKYPEEFGTVTTKAIGALYVFPFSAAE